ncbi:MAG: metallophosphoesterase, partial [Magnetococcales bacterium]|nr:metallophosphoesterase [Magnetococcales bacterium]
MPKIIQITDFHLFADPNHNYRGILPAKTLKTVLVTIMNNHPDCQLILITGDLVSDDFLGYEVLKEILGNLGLPVYVLPGNHDNPKEMQQRLVGGLVYFSQNLILDGWSIVMLNSAVEGRVEGILNKQELQKL